MHPGARGAARRLESGDDRDTWPTPSLSLGEDATSGALTAIAFLAPILAVLAVAAMGIAGATASRSRRRAPV